LKPGPRISVSVAENEETAMLDPRAPVTVVPYYGPWTVMNNEGEILVVANTQEEAIRVARAQLPEGSILAIDACSCVIRYLVPQAIPAQINPSSASLANDELIQKSV
jgi:hypothetical protein